MSILTISYYELIHFVISKQKAESKISNFRFKDVQINQKNITPKIKKYKISNIFLK